VSFASDTALTSLGNNRQEVRILAGRVYVAHELNSAEAGHRP
jgi:hypothetical protein